MEPCLVRPSDIRSHAPEQSRRADALQGREVDVVARQVEVGQQVAPLRQQFPLDVAHGDQFRTGVPGGGQRAEHACGLTQFERDGLEPGGAVDEVGNGDRFLGDDQVRPFPGRHHRQRNRIGGNRVEMQFGEALPLRVPLVMVVDGVVAHGDARAVERVAVGVLRILDREAHKSVDAPRFAVVGD